MGPIHLIPAASTASAKARFRRGRSGWRASAPIPAIRMIDRHRGAPPRVSPSISQASPTARAAGFRRPPHAPRRRLRSRAVIASSPHSAISPGSDQDLLDPGTLVMSFLFRCLRAGSRPRLIRRDRDSRRSIARSRRSTAASLAPPVTDRQDALSASERSASPAASRGAREHGAPDCVFDPAIEQVTVTLGTRSLQRAVANPLRERRARPVAAVQVEDRFVVEDVGARLETIAAEAEPRAGCPGGADHEAEPVLGRERRGRSVSLISSS